jgi:methionine-rich copper-binding protein CopC
MIRLRTALLALALAIGGAGAALAHAHLRSATPAVGSTVRAAPAELVLRFTEKLEPAFSTAEVRGPDGSRVEDGKAAIDPRDATVLRVKLKPLAAGTYKVAWHVVSVDTHKTEGDFTFTVAAAS